MDGQHVNSGSEPRFPEEFDSSDVGSPNERYHSYHIPDPLIRGNEFAKPTLQRDKTETTLHN